MRRAREGKFDFTDALFFCQCPHFSIAHYKRLWFNQGMNSAQHTTRTQNNEWAVFQYADGTAAVTRQALNAKTGEPHQRMWWFAATTKERAMVQWLKWSTADRKGLPYPRKQQ